MVTDENGEQLSIPANELEIFFFVLTFAGSDTTKNALAAGLQAFVANPGQIERYRADEAIRPSAVEEVLRWSTPVAFWTRSTKVDMQMDGVTIPKGDRVVSMLRSANRDEEVFEDPFTFDIGRTENPHVTFGGGGPHHCLGAMLARAEIRAVLDELLCRADDITLGPPKVAYPEPDEQHVDLRRDGDFAAATLARRNGKHADPGLTLEVVKQIQAVAKMVGGEMFMARRRLGRPGRPEQCQARRGMGQVVPRPIPDPVEARLAQGGCPQLRVWIVGCCEDLGSDAELDGPVGRQVGDGHVCRQM